MIELKKKELLRFNQEKIKDKNVLVRVDFNVDIYKGKILDKYRIFSVKETIAFLKPAKRIVIISHFGDPKGPSDFKKYSLKKILPSIEKLLKIKIGFLKSLDSKPKEKISLLENLRLFKGEKECYLNFAKKLASLGEVFVFEAFSVAHRKHTSVYLLPKILPTYYGFNFEKEIKILNKVILNLKNSTALVLGGAKISTKLPLIKKFLNDVDIIILGGGLANNFLKAKGFEIGNSLVEKNVLKEIKKIYSAKILTPFDFHVLNKNDVFHRFLGEIQKEDKIFDVGDESLKIFFEELKRVKNIVFSGPLGLVEDKRFEKGTLKLIKFLSQLKKFILIGGGDTLAFLEKKKMLKKFKISTGGGAMLYYLAKEKLWPKEK